MTVHQRTDLNRLGELPEHATVVLAAARDELSPESASSLLDWVEGGGHLIVAVESVLERDPLLDSLDVEAQWDPEEDDQATDEKPPSSPVASPVTLPDGRTLRVDVLPGPRLIDRDGTNAWAFEADGGVRILDLPVGDGRVTLLSTLRMVGNQDIGRVDHARFLAWLTEGDNNEVWLIRWLDTPSLPGWLLEHAPAAIAACAAFVMVVLWRVIPRFGPLLPAPAPDRKSLLEHIRALGRFYSDRRRLGGLLKRVRADCQERLDRVAPETRGLDGAGRLERAAQLTGLKPRDLLHAFTVNPSTHHEFTGVVRTLAAFRQRLEQRQLSEERR
jgi:hypothetical protein